MGGGVGGGQELARVREETPGVAEFHAAGAPDEQLLAERPLQPRDPLGQGLLGEEQLGRGPAEVELLDGGEGSHLGQVQVHARHLRRQPRVVKTAGWPDSESTWPPTASAAPRWPASSADPRQDYPLSAATHRTGRQWGGNDIATTFERFEANEDYVDIAGLRSMFPDIHWHDSASLAETVDWQHLPGA